MNLTREHLQSAAWKAVEAHLRERLQKLREINDGHMDEIKTAAIRGQVAEVKALLSLGKPSQGIEPNPAEAAWGDPLGDQHPMSY